MIKKKKKNSVILSRGGLSKYIQTDINFFQKQLQKKEIYFQNFNDHTKITMSIKCLPHTKFIL